MRARPLQKFFRTLATQTCKEKPTNPIKPVNELKSNNMDDNFKISGLGMFAAGVVVGGGAVTLYALNCAENYVRRAIHW